jgi:hypothetical protein
VSKSAGEVEFESDLVGKGTRILHRLTVGCLIVSEADPVSLTGAYLRWGELLRGSLSASGTPVSSGLSGIASTRNMCFRLRHHSST